MKKLCQPLQYLYGPQGHRPVCRLCCPPASRQYFMFNNIRLCERNIFYFRVGGGGGEGEGEGEGGLSLNDNYDLKTQY